MNLFDLLCLQNPALIPERCKIHLASHNGNEYPLDEYLAGRFNEWQRWQSKRNFDRAWVVSLIAMRANQWLFAGAYRSGSPVRYETDAMWYYPLEEEPSCHDLVGRLVLSFERVGRQSYLVAENWANQIQVRQLYEEPLSIAEFPGFKAVNLSWPELSVVVTQDLPSWRAALSSVAGVYLISDAHSHRL